MLSSFEIKDLQSLIRKEIKLYQEHKVLLTEEGRFLTKFNAEKLSEITEKREILYNLMREAKDARMAFVKSKTGNEKMRLSEFVATNVPTSQLTEMNDLVKKLKNAVTQSRSSGIEFSQVVNFALNVVNGTLSIFTSASQSITRSYSRKGVVKESFHPSEDRKSGIIKEA